MFRYLHLWVHGFNSFPFTCLISRILLRSLCNYDSKILIHVTVIHLIRNCTRLKLIHTFNTHNWCSEQRLRSASQAAALCTVHPLDLPLLLALQGGGRFPPAHVATLISYSTHWLHFDVSMNLFEYCNLNHGLPLSCFSHHLVRSNKFKSIVRLLPDVLASENAGENSPPSDAGAKGFDLVSSEWSQVVTSPNSQPCPKHIIHICLHCLLHAKV